MRTLPSLTCGILFIASLAGSCAGEVLRLAATTSTYESGLLDRLFPLFEKKHNCKIHIISAGTGKAIRLAENGDVDVILVHDRQAEDKFVADGHGVNRREVMHNDFLIVGPKDDPAKISGMRNAREALRRIFHSESAFVSRGDDSGTHRKEKYLWSKLNLTPDGAWYLEAGQGMSATLRVADEKGAYLLTDRATYHIAKDKLRLAIMVEEDKDLINAYGAIAVNPRKHKHAKYELAMALLSWLTSPECRKMITGYEKAGRQLYHVDEKAGSEAGH